MEKIFLVFAISSLVIFIIHADVKKQTEQNYINKKIFFFATYALSHFSEG